MTRTKEEIEELRGEGIMIRHWFDDNTSEFGKNYLNRLIEIELEIERSIKKSIRIPISTNDAEELREGATFEWSFPVEGSASSEWIDVELVGTDEEVM